MNSGGVAIRFLASLALTRLLQKLLFGISATDAMAFVVIALVLCAVPLLLLHTRPQRDESGSDGRPALRMMPWQCLLDSQGDRWLDCSDAASGNTSCRQAIAARTIETPTKVAKSVGCTPKSRDDSAVSGRCRPATPRIRPAAMSFPASNADASFSSKTGLQKKTKTGPFYQITFSAN